MSGGASLDELKQALRASLEQRGTMNKIKAQVRAEIFHALDGDDDHKAQSDLSNTNLLINELIREYLEFNQYHHTSSVLVAESGMQSGKESPFNRNFLVNRLHVPENEQTAKLPLLNVITALLQHGRLSVEPKVPSSSTDRVITASHGTATGHANSENDAIGDDTDSERVPRHNSAQGNHDDDPEPLFFSS